jgi:hypothetical protein
VTTRGACAAFSLHEVVEIDTASSRVPDGLRAMYDRAGILSGLSAPIAAGGQIFGAFGVNFTQAHLQ